MAVTMSYGAAPTYVKIASQTASGTPSSITFSNIPQGYTDLIVVGNAKQTSGTGSGRFQFNGDTGTNYSFTYFWGDGTNVGSGRAANATGGMWNWHNSLSNTNFETIIFHFISYSSSVTNKSALVRSGTAELETELSTSVWRSTSPITSIKFYIDAAGTFVNGSTFTLYGIKAAFVPKASGGDIIVNDGTYWYHAFRNTGALITNQALTADVLVVAGGGGGASGGGGAGGYRTTTGLSLTSVTKYVATIGSGGSGSDWQSTPGYGIDSSFSTITSTGGGRGGAVNANTAGAGGSGGGGGGNTTSMFYAGGTGNTPTTSPSQGYTGGTGGWSANNQGGGGGGGAAAVGSNTAGASIGGAGGAGSSALSSWGLLTGTGVNVSGTVYFAGGGGGGGNTTGGAGGNGGGGAGGTNALGNYGIASSGGGGGGTVGLGGNGGSGVVIVRYPV